MTTQTRKPAGAPASTGGQFAGRTRDRSGNLLPASEPGLTVETAQQRIDFLETMLETVSTPEVRKPLFEEKATLELFIDNEQARHIKETSMTDRFGETQRYKRGHQFYPGKTVANKIPALYGNEKNTVQPGGYDVHAHYFANNMDWYVMELDPTTGECFGAVTNHTHGETELGYFNLQEMEHLTVGPNFYPVERDLYFDKGPAYKTIPAWRSRAHEKLEPAALREVQGIAEEFQSTGDEYVLTYKLLQFGLKPAEAPTSDYATYRLRTIDA